MNGCQTGCAQFIQGGEKCAPGKCAMASYADKQDLRQQILAQIDRCAQLAYAAGHHFAEHGKHAPSSMMTKADADATLIRLIEEYAAPGVGASDGKVDCTQSPMGEGGGVEGK